jgi:hypothetical protein
MRWCIALPMMARKQRPPPDTAMHEGALVTRQKNDSFWPLTVSRDRPFPTRSCLSKKLVDT